MNTSSNHDPVDVLIIGAGASGAAIAWNLTETRMRILCLEQGDWMTPSKYPTNSQNWEAQQFGAYHIDPNVRGLETDYPINNQDSPIDVLNFNGVGGSTIVYAAHFPRLHPSDFKVKTLDGVADDWPISYDDLDPYFLQNDRIMGVSGLAGDPMYPPKDLPLPPLPIGMVGEVVAKGFDRLGWHWWPSDAAILSQPYEGRDKCLNLNPCSSGCAQGAKSSTDITYWPQAIRSGVELRTRCRVREVTVNEHGMADGVIYYDADGHECFQKAEVVIMACNGVGTPRILLNSKSPQFPDGLANRSGLVGKNLMFHPVGVVRGIFEERLDTHKGPQGSCILSKEFYETDPDRDFVRGYNMQVARGAAGPLATAFQGFRTGDIPWGPGHHEKFHQRFDHTVNVLALCEDLPEECNRVTLDPDLVDSDGIPAPKITYRLSENSRKMLAHGLARGEEVMRAAGAKEIQKVDLLRSAGWHLLGTARMGNDPTRSVVNSWGRSHDVKNLFIVDGSIFVTGGGVNPTSTIQALALYIGDKIKENLANLFDD
ncbi:MAG: GMC family oxidoreductase [Proteobacteria bacterium]|nr:GMC family oxidoreductase [Pseudomonadota bacterium]MDA1308384.1 GMC family oxidoreductase [Pseudomonadota bacterium]